MKNKYCFQKAASSIFLFVFLCFGFNSCGTTKEVITEPDISIQQELEELSTITEEHTSDQEQPEIKDTNTISLLFAGDIMAHSVNYVISDYPKIWRDVKYMIEPCDLAFANIEAPIDDTQKPQSYPNFNMPQAYIEAAVDAGFDVFSLCNNHTNDQ